MSAADESPGGLVAPPRFRPTIKDVARVAEVHFTTVSLALRGHPRIPLETRNRILAAAARVGYRRDEVAAALIRRRANSRDVQRAPVIAYVVNQSPDDPSDPLFGTAHQRRMYSGARQQAEAMGYEFELAVVGRGAHTARSLRKHLRERAVRGMIIGAFGPDTKELELDCRDLCVVKIDSRHVRPAAPLVTNDQMFHVQLAFQQMRTRGYRRVGMAIGDLDERSSDDMHRSAWYLEQSRIAPEDRVSPLIFPPGSTPSVINLLREWIRQERVDAVLCNWTSVISMVRGAGFRVPEQVACACVSLSQPLAKLAGIVADFELVGRRAAALLENLMRSEAPSMAEEPATTYIRGHWHDGASAPLRK